MTERATRKSQRARVLEPVSARGKAAQLTSGGTILLAGLLTIWSAWAELTCPYGGPAGREWCRTTVGVGGILVMAGLGVAALAAVVLWRGVWRPLDPDGGDGWRWGEGVLIALSGVVLGLMVIDGQICPAGYQMATGFDLCISEADAAVRVGSTSQLALQLGAVVAGLALAFVVVAWRRIPWPIATAITVVAATLGTLWFLEDTVGLPW